MLAAGGCTGTARTDVPTGAPPSRSNGSVASSCGQWAGVKPPLKGLIVSDAKVPDGLAASISVNVAWSQLQPTEGGPIVRPNPIDAAIKGISQDGGPCAGIRLRVLAGTEAPSWAKRLGGAPVTVSLSYDMRSGTIGRFWTPQFGAAYAELQRRLAAAYDDQPRIREVAISRCMTFYAEPMTRQVADARTVSALVAAGYTTADDLRCQQAELAAGRSWRRTSSYLALNPYDVIDPAGGTWQSVDKAIAIASTCRRLLARRCVLGNNSVRVPTLAGNYPQLYARMRRLGPPVAFQLAAPARVGDVLVALKWCIGFGAGSVELTGVSASQLSAQTHGGRDSAVRDWLSLN